MIDVGLVGDWDAEVIEAASRFDQGDLVALPPFFYAANPTSGVWATSRAFAEEVEDNETLVIELDPADAPPYGILTSQGCDIADTLQKPWVQVAPVYPLDGLHDAARRTADIRRNSVPHLVLLEPPTVGGLWVVDLRIEVPIEKSWLAGREPIQAFPTEADQRQFARRLSGRLLRPSLPDAVHDVVVRPLRRVLDRANAGLRTGLSEAGVEFRLAIRTHPDDTHECRLYVIGRRTAVPQVVRDAIEAWWAAVPKTQDRVVVLGSRFGTSDEFTMREYLTSELLDDRAFGEDLDVA